MAKIAIIGGGYTGLTAAYRLTKLGHQVHVFERGSEVGGLAADFTVAGAHLEKTYHHLFRTDTDIIGLTAELGIEDTLGWHTGSLKTYYNHRLHDFSTPVDLLKFTPLPLWDRIRTALVALYLNRTKNWRQFVDVSAYEWMKKFNGRRAAQVIWEPLLKGKFDERYKEVSMAWLWARLHIRSRSRRPGEMKEKLGYFAGGFHTFTRALVEKITAQGGTIHTGAEVTSIAEHKDGVSVTVDGTEAVFDRLLATVPSHVFADLAGPGLASEYRDRLAGIDYLGAVVMVFTSEQKIGDAYWYNINDLTKPFLVFINHTNLIDRRNYAGRYVYYIGTYRPHEHRSFTLSDDQLSDEWFTELARIFPEFDRDKIEERHIFRLKNAQHIVTTDYEDRIPAMQTPLKHVWLANFSQIYPEDRGTNYAVREGTKAAQLITDSLAP